MAFQIAGMFEHNSDLYKCILGAPVGIILSRKSTDEIIQVNDEACKILQCSATDLSQKNVKQFFKLHEPRPEESYIQFAQRIHMADVAQLIEATVSPTSTASVSAIAKEVRGQESIVCTVFWNTKRDVTQELMDHSPTFMGTLSLEGRLQFASSSAKALFGLNPDEMHGKMMQEYLHPEDRSQFEQCLDAIRHGDGIASGVWRIKRGNEEMYCPITLISEVDKESHPTQIFITAYDNTQIRQQRTQAMTEMQDFSKAAFSDIAGHLEGMDERFRKLTTKIDYLASRSLSPQSKERVEEAKSLLHLLNQDIVTAREKSKSMEKNMSLHRVLFDLKESIQEVIKKYSEMTEQKSIRLTLDYDSRLPLSFYADASRIKEVLSYILSNSVKYSNNGGSITLRVKSLSEKPNGTMVVAFEVEDNGMPISFEAQRHLFQSHLALDATSERTSHEAGKRLNLCRSIVAILQGTFGLTSDQQSGAKFYFSLPLQKGERKEYPDAPPINTETKNFFQKWNLKILIVDDVALNRKIFAHVLQILGVEKILHAENGQQAVECYTAGEANFIFMDIQMPVMDGFDAVRNIRRIEEFNKKHVPIFFSSSTEITHEQAVASGADGRIGKPYKVEEFIQVIKQNARQP